MNKKLTIILITFLSLITLTIGGIFCYLIFNDFSFNDVFNSKYETLFDLEYNNSFDSINIDVDTFDIDISYSTNNKFEVLINGLEKSKDDFKISTKDNKLSIIKSKNNFNFLFNFSFKKNKINIKIPKDFSNTINLKTISGDIAIDKFNNLNLISNQTSGNLSIKNIKSISSKTTSGNINIDNVFDFVKIDLVSGNVKINNLNLFEDSSIKTVSGNITIKKTNQIFIESKTTTGKIKVNDNYRKADNILKVSTTTGNIYVN